MYEAASGERVRNLLRAQVFSTFWRGAVTLKVMRRLRAEGADIPDALFEDSPAVRGLRRLLEL